MKNLINFVGVFVLMWLVFLPDAKLPIGEIYDSWNVSSLWTPAASVLVKPTNTYGFDVSLPKAIKDKKLAHNIAGLAAGLAEEIERDGVRSTPQIRYNTNVFDAFKEAINIKFDGKSLHELSPEASKEVAAVFANELPDGTTELDATSRKKTVELFRALSYGCSLIK